MKEIGFLIFLLAYSTVFALFEIQIEGNKGWAAALPCWRVQNKWTRLLIGDKPITGYHVLINVLMLLLLQFPPLLFVTWSWRLECLVIGFILAVWEIEDFLWFIFNPNYGLKNFKPEKVTWHPRWWGPLPDWYWWLPFIWEPLIYLGWPVLGTYH